MMSLLAETVQHVPDDTISLTNLATFIAGVGGVILAFYKRAHYKEQGRKEVQEGRVTIDGQPLSFSQQSPAASQNEVAELKRDIDARLNKIELCLSEERTTARIALGKIHQRLDSTSVATATLQGKVEEVGGNVARMLDIMMNHKPRTGR